MAGGVGSRPLSGARLTVYIARTVGPRALICIPCLKGEHGICDAEACGCRGRH